MARTTRSSSSDSSPSSSMSEGAPISTRRATNRALSGLAEETDACARMRNSVSTRPAFAPLGSLPRSQSYRVGRATRRIPASWDLLSDSAAWRFLHLFDDRERDDLAKAGRDVRGRRRCGEPAVDDGRTRTDVRQERAERGAEQHDARARPRPSSCAAPATPRERCSPGRRAISR